MIEIVKDVPNNQVLFQVFVGLAICCAIVAIIGIILIIVKNSTAGAIMEVVGLCICIVFCAIAGSNSKGTAYQIIKIENNTVQLDQFYNEYEIIEHLGGDVWKVRIKE